jgi:8-oxo-dGTP pyrophosphatase MutT (NUDIX family)
MHHDEMWQVYRPNGEPIVGSGWNSALGNPEETGADAIVGVAVIFVYRKNDDDILELLWQRRSERVDRFPGDYDISAGGHINLGESLVEGAVRECHEEIGAEIGADDLRFVTMRPFNKNRFAWVFAVDWTEKKETFKFNDEEVSEVKWVPFEETEAFCLKSAKAPLKKDKLTIALLREWFLHNGDLQA